MAADSKTETDDPEVLYDDENYHLKRLAPRNVDDFAVRALGLYAEFSSVAQLGDAWLLNSAGHGNGYTSLRHSTGQGDDIPEELHAKFKAIQNGEVA